MRLGVLAEAARGLAGDASLPSPALPSDASADDPLEPFTDTQPRRTLARRTTTTITNNVVPTSSVAAPPSAARYPLLSKPRLVRFWLPLLLSLVLVGLLGWGLHIRTGQAGL